MWRNMLDELETALDEVFAQLFPPKSNPSPGPSPTKGGEKSTGEVTSPVAPPSFIGEGDGGLGLTPTPSPSPAPTQRREPAAAPLIQIEVVKGSEVASAPSRAEQSGGGLGSLARTTQPDSLLRRLNWPILRPLARYLGGDERSLVRGPGMEVAEIREYQPGDDVRHIDWSVTARSDRPYVREAFVERALDAWLVVDVSGSVDWGTAQCIKRDRALEFAAVAGQLLGRNGNRVGALMFAEKPLGIVPPGVGRVHLLRLLSHVRETPRQADPAPTDLAGALTQVYTIIRRKSLVLVVSDFLVGSGWQRPLGQLAQRHEVVAVRLSDPREGEIPDIGWVTFEDPETGLQLTVDTGDRKLRDRFQKAAAAQAEAVRADLVRCGVDELQVSTGSDLLPTLISFLNARKFKRGARSGAGTTNLSALHGEN